MEVVARETVKKDDQRNKDLSSFGGAAAFNLEAYCYSIAG